MVLGVADDQHVLQQHDAERPETAGVQVPPERVGRSVVLRIEDGVHVQHRDHSPATVLPELHVVDGAMVIDHVDGATVLAHDQIGGIAEELTVQPVERHLGATDDRIRGVVVRRSDGAIKRDRVEVRQSPSRRKDVRALADGFAGAAHRRQQRGDHERHTVERRCRGSHAASMPVMRDGPQPVHSQACPSPSPSRAVFRA